ncbi:MAG: pilus assembly protein N-terminal domain-containing protein, partial [Candidatus Omnitrophota bacterium]
MRKLLFGLLSAAFVVILPFNGYSSSVTGEELKLYLGQPEIIEVSSPKRIAIGNPAVADIANITKSELTINPKTKGDTTLVIWDDFGEQSYTLRVFTEDMSNIKRRIDNILSSLNMPGIKTKAEDEEDRVVLLGSVKFASDKEKVATALAPLKNKI